MASSCTTSQSSGFLLLCAGVSGALAIAPAPSPGFDVGVALDTLHLAWASYCNRSALDGWDCQWCHRSRDVTLMKYLQDTDAGTQGYVAVEKARSRVVVAFRGSFNDQNTIEDGMIWRDRFGPAPSNVSVHRGFNSAYASLREDMLHGISKGLERCAGCGVLFTGHSLGAAVATLGAAEVAAQGPSPMGGVHLFTFGSPRVGNDAFAWWASGLLNGTSIRMAREGDLVPSLPPPLLGYRHLAREVWNRHEEGEDDYYVVCDDSGEDASCYVSKLDNWSGWQHTHYMGIEGGSCKGGPDLKRDFNLHRPSRASSRVDAMLV